MTKGWLEAASNSVIAVSILFWLSHVPFIIVGCALPNLTPTIFEIFLS